MKSGRILVVSLALLCGAPAFAEDVPAEVCTGQDCMPQNVKPAEACEGEGCAALPSEGVTECTGQDCDAIRQQPGSGPEIETVPVQPAQ